MSTGPSSTALTQADLLTFTAATHATPAAPTPAAAAAIPLQRGPMLMGLTGLFALVLGGLILAQPEPLHAPAIELATAAAVAQLEAVAPSTASGEVSGLVVRHLTRGPADARDDGAHFTIQLDAPAGPTIRVGTPAPESTGGATAIVVSVTGNRADDAADWRADPAVRTLVERLRDRLKLADRQVSWS